MMDTTTPSRAQRRKAATEQAILDAAERLFLSQGLHLTTTEQIATAADVAVGSLYVHFGNKDGLYLAVMKRALTACETYLHAGYASALTPSEQVVAVGDAYIQFAFEHPGYFRMLTFPQVANGGGTALAAGLAEMQTRVAALIQRLGTTLRESLDPPHRDKMDAAQLGYFFWGAWNGIIALHLRTDWVQLSQADITAILHEGRRVLTAGIIAIARADDPA